jgi:hypothetical protein
MYRRHNAAQNPICVLRKQPLTAYVTDKSKEETLMFNKYGKKVLSLAMATAMAATMAAPAFADTVITATYEDIDIAVDVPDTGTVTINPYGMPVYFDKSDKTQAKVVGQQIVTAPMALKNQGDVKLKVSAKVTTTNGKNSAIVFSSSDPVEATDTTKKAHVVLQIASIATAIGTEGNSLNDLIITGYTTDSTWSSATAKQVTLDTAAAASSSDMVTLAASTVGTDGTVTYTANSIAGVRLTGKVLTSPTEAWTTKDSFTATVAYTFVPDTTT